MSTCRKYFKGLDDYGHLVQINFNRNGETVNTIIGGLISFLIRWGLRFFLLLKIIDVYSHAKTDFLTIDIAYDFSVPSNNNVNIDDMKILLYMRKLSTEPGKNMFKALPWDVSTLKREILYKNAYAEYYE